MPTIQIKDGYRLQSSFRSWELQKSKIRKHRNTGEFCQEWEAIRWYSNLEAALHDCAQLRLRIADAEDIGLAIAEVKGWLADLRQALADALNVKDKT